MSSTRIKLVTFDVTNTLLKFRQGPGRQYALAGRAHGLHASEEQLADDFRRSYRAMCRQHPNFGRSAMSWQEWWRQVVCRTFQDHLPDPSLANKIAAQLIADYKRESSWRVVDGGVELLAHLRRRGVAVGIISNFDPRVHDIIKNIGLLLYFDFIITSYEAGYSKPDAKIFDGALACVGSNISPQNALHIGDNVLLDYCGARDAGWNAFLINGKINEKDLALVHPTHVYKELVSLKDAIIDNKIQLSFVNIRHCNKA